MDLWCIRRVCRRFVERGENRADTDMDSFSNCKMHHGSFDKYSWVLTLHAISLQSIPQPHGWKVASSNSSRSSKRIFSPELTLFPGSYSVSVPVLQQWHVKDPGPSAKYADGRLHLDTHTPLTQRSWSGLTIPLSRHSMGTYQEMSIHAATVILARWATVDQSWHNEWNKLVQANLHLKQQQQKNAGREWIVKHSPQILASEEKATTSGI